MSSGEGHAPSRYILLLAGDATLLRSVNKMLRLAKGVLLEDKVAIQSWSFGELAGILAVAISGP